MQPSPKKELRSQTPLLQSPRTPKTPAKRSSSQAPETPANRSLSQAPKTPASASLTVHSALLPSPVRSHSSQSSPRKQCSGFPTQINVTVNPIIEVSGFNSYRGEATEYDFDWKLMVVVDSSPVVPSNFPPPLRPGMLPPPLQLNPSWEVQELMTTLLRQEGFDMEDCIAARIAIGWNGNEHDAVIEALKDSPLSEEKAKKAMEIYKFACAVKGGGDDDFVCEAED